MQTTPDQDLVNDLPLDRNAVLWLRHAVRASRTILVACEPPGSPEDVSCAIRAINAGLCENVGDEELDALIAAAVKALGRYYDGPVGVELGHCPDVDGPAVFFVPAESPQSPFEGPAPSAAYH